MVMSDFNFENTPIGAMNKFELNHLFDIVWSAVFV